MTWNSPHSCPAARTLGAADAALGVRFAACATVEEMLNAPDLHAVLRTDPRSEHAHVHSN